MPAIITTTAAVAGLACLEIYKLVWGCQDLSCYRDSNINLSADDQHYLLLRFQPRPAPTYRVGPSSLGKCVGGHPGGSGICSGTVSGEGWWPCSKGSAGHSTPEMDLGAAVGWECCQAVRNQHLPWLPPSTETLPLSHLPSFMPSCDALGCPWGRGSPAAPWQAPR